MRNGKFLFFKRNYDISLKREKRLDLPKWGMQGASTVSHPFWPTPANKRVAQWRNSQRGENMGHEKRQSLGCFQTETFFHAVSHLSCFWKPVHWKQSFQTWNSLCAFSTAAMVPPSHRFVFPSCVGVIALLLCAHKLEHLEQARK